MWLFRIHIAKNIYKLYWYYFMSSHHTHKHPPPLNTIVWNARILALNIPITLYSTTCTKLTTICDNISFNYINEHISLHPFPATNTIEHKLSRPHPALYARSTKPHSRRLHNTVVRGARAFPEEVRRPCDAHHNDATSAKPRQRCRADAPGASRFRASHQHESAGLQQRIGCADGARHAGKGGQTVRWVYYILRLYFSQNFNFNVFLYASFWSVVAQISVFHILSFCIHFLCIYLLAGRPAPLLRRCSVPVFMRKYLFSYVWYTAKCTKYHFVFDILCPHSQTRRPVRCAVPRWTPSARMTCPLVSQRLIDDAFAWSIVIDGELYACVEYVGGFLLWCDKCARGNP